MRALDEVLKLDPVHGLYPTFISNDKVEVSFGNSDISIGAMGDSFYEYLLKIWLQGGKKEMKYRRLYDHSVNGIFDKLVSAHSLPMRRSCVFVIKTNLHSCQIHMSRPNYLTYVAELKNDKVQQKMDHLSCFLGGTLVLGAYVSISLYSLIQNYAKLN